MHLKDTKSKLLSQLQKMDSWNSLYTVARYDNVKITEEVEEIIYKMGGKD